MIRQLEDMKQPNIALKIDLQCRGNFHIMSNNANLKTSHIYDILHKETFLVVEPCSCKLASNVQLSCHNVQSFEYAFLLYQNNRCIELHSVKNHIQLF